MYLKACIIGRTDASHLESLPGNEVYQLALEEASELPKMLVETAIA